MLFDIDYSQILWVLLQARFSNKSGYNLEFSYIKALIEHPVNYVYEACELLAILKETIWILLVPEAPYGANLLYSSRVSSGW